HGTVEAFGRYRQHSLGDRQRGRVADGGIAHERVDRGPAGVAGADTVAAFGLEVVEEVQYQWRVEETLRRPPAETSSATNATARGAAAVLGGMRSLPTLSTD